MPAGDDPEPAHRDHIGVIHLQSTDGRSPCCCDPLNDRALFNPKDYALSQQLACAGRGECSVRSQEGFKLGGIRYVITTLFE